MTQEPLYQDFQRVESWVEIYFKNCNYTQLLQIITSFAFGVIFSPFSYGPLFFISFLVLYEFVYAFFTNTECPFWTLPFRASVVLWSVFGWILGRTLVGWRNPFKENPQDC